MSFEVLKHIIKVMFWLNLITVIISRHLCRNKQGLSLKYKGPFHYFAHLIPKTTFQDWQLHLMLQFCILVFIVTVDNLVLPWLLAYAQFPLAVSEIVWIW